jgi:hypothetical protein
LESQAGRARADSTIRHVVCIRLRMLEYLMIIKEI